MESIAGKFFEAILLFALEVCFEFIEFFSCIVLLFLSSFVLCSLCSIVNVYGGINDLTRVFFLLVHLSKNILHFVKLLFVT